MVGQHQNITGCSTVLLWIPVFSIDDTSCGSKDPQSYPNKKNAMSYTREISSRVHKWFFVYCSHPNDRWNHRITIHKLQKHLVLTFNGLLWVGSNNLMASACYRQPLFSDPSSHLGLVNAHCYWFQMELHCYSWFHISSRWWCPMTNCRNVQLCTVSYFDKCQGSGHSIFISELWVKTCLICRHRNFLTHDRSIWMRSPTSQMHSTWTSLTTVTIWQREIRIPTAAIHYKLDHTLSSISYLLFKWIEKNVGNN